MKSLVWLDLIILCFFNLRIGATLGIWGIRKIINLKNLVAFLCSIITFILLLWFQKISDIHHETEFFLLASFCFFIPYFFKRYGSQRSQSAFLRASVILEPFCENYLNPAIQINSFDQDRINKKRKSLTKAIFLFNMARKLELRGTVIGGGLLGNYNIEMYSERICPVCEEKDTFTLLDQDYGGYTSRCSNCEIVIHVDQRGNSFNNISILETHRDSTGPNIPKKYFTTDKNRTVAAIAIAQIGLIYLLLGNMSKSKSSLITAFEELSELNNIGKKESGISCLYLGEIERLSNNNLEAKKWYKISIELFKQVKDETNLQITKSLLNDITTKEKN